jgi:hypothetical protein
MAQIIMLAHIPRLRIEGSEDLAIADGVLTKLPWEQYDDLTLGAFSDWRERYVATDPVFYWWQGELDLPILRPGSVPQNSLQEMKTPRAGWGALAAGVGLGVLDAFHRAAVDPLWAALTLAAPQAAPAPPRSSVTFLLSPGDAHLAIGDQRMFGARVQGEADQELVYGADLAGPALGAAAVARAAGLVERMSWALEHPDVGPIVRQLLATTEVALSPTDRLTLAVVALEAALLPEITSGLTETFARRLANLLGTDDAQRARIHAEARTLYGLRSATLHGAEGGSASAAALGPRPHVDAERLLAAAVEAICEGVAAGTPLDSLRQEIDSGPPAGRTAPPPASEDAVPGAPDERLHPARPWFSGTLTVGLSLASPEGVLLSWSPLVGLGYEGDEVAEAGLKTPLLTLTADEVVSMEQKDIRRDFISSLVLTEQPIAGLAAGAPSEGSAALDEQVIRGLTRRRDLAVAGLRLRGYDAFDDPELLGWYVYDGVIRHRRETVLRQSVMMGLGRPPEQRIAAGDVAGVLEAWSAVADYDANARDPRIDWTLHLFRRAHDRRFTSPETRATMLLCVLEATVGRFRGKDDEVSLEALVGALEGVDPAAAGWFSAEGRSFRNAVAHGYWSPPPAGPETSAVDADHQPLASLRAICRAALAESMSTWAGAPATTRRAKAPRELVTATLEAKVRG